jgi:hypothetical protein
MGWRRAANAKPGKPFIPDRETLNEMNRTAREAAAKRKITASKGRSKK